MDLHCFYLSIGVSLYSVQKLPERLYLFEMDLDINIIYPYQTY